MRKQCSADSVSRQDLPMRLFHLLMRIRNAVNALLDSLSIRCLLSYRSNEYQSYCYQSKTLARGVLFKEEPAFESLLIPIIKEYHKRGLVLDLYSGRGREACLFAEAGYEVVGIESNKELVDDANWLAERCKIHGTFYCSDVFAVQDLPPFDICYFSSHMYSTLFPRARRTELLRLYKADMKRGSIMVLFTFGESACVRKTYSSRLRELLLNIMGIREPGLFLVGMHLCKTFTLSELISEGTEAGLSVLRAFSVRNSGDLVVIFGNL